MRVARRIAVGLAGMIVIGAATWLAVARSSVSDNGPLGESATIVDTSVCMLDADGLDWWYSGDSLRNRSSSTVTLDRIDLVEPVNIEFVEAFVYPIGRDGADFVALGPSAADGAPTGADAEPGVSSWAQRTDFAGARITQAEELGFVLHLRSKTTDISSLESLVIHYESNGDDYILRTNTRMKVQRTPCF